jgi:hypothetical protein
MEVRMNSAVALVLDRKFGDRVAGLAQEMPVWIVSSDENNSAVEHVRGLLGGAAEITTLLVAGGETPSDTCLRALYDIDEHHGTTSACTPYERVLVFEAEPALLSPQASEDLGFARVTKTEFGFIIEKERRQSGHAALSHST